MTRGFSGTYTPRLDDKFRLTLPAKFRAQFAGEIVVSKGNEHCLELLTQDVYEERAKRWEELGRTSVSGRNFSRWFSAGCDEQEPDSQGRITLSADHRTWASLTKSCTVIGRFSTVEIWDTASWEALLAATADDYATAVEPGTPT